MASDSAVSPVRSDWQFSLRELFGLTTFAACALAIAKAWDPGTLVAALGAMLAWLNYRRRFRVIQWGRGRWLAVTLGIALFAVSMFLPAFKAWGDMQGWATAWTMIMLAIPPALHQSEFDSNALFSYLAHLQWIFLTNAANLAGALTPLTLFWRKENVRRVLGMVLHAAIPVVWLLIIGSTNRHLVGYYVWATGLTLLASTFLIDQTTARTMLVSTSIFGTSRLAVYIMQITL